MISRKSILRSRALAAPLAVARKLRSFVRDLTPRGRAKRRRERAFDEARGIDTAGVIALVDLGLSADETESFIRYQPSPTGSLAAALECLPLRDFRDFSFIDIGAGKGRVLVLALEHGFKRVVGVEYSEDLCQIARRNLAIARASHPQAPSAEVQCGDATLIDLPSGPCIVFLYNPFVGEIAERFVRHLERQLEREPRPLYLLYLNPVERERVASSRALRELPTTLPDFALFASEQAAD